ncbi:acyl-CoA dehydrogenase [Gayadomonas joobiniege]|uniref:acyl-CoA dehydrogenase n=1 Tax=Gayadomonas joobiniege TaxID=1234606 RepID=UPI0003829177|nr:acyl-CoA dehydrogenase [Gayadomonas joobiniege]
MLVICLIIVLAVIIVLRNQDLRLRYVTGPIFKVFKKVLPAMSTTEQEAMEAGDIWWDGEIFSGRPDWQKMHQYPDAQMSPEEQSFLNNQVETLLDMLDDFKIVHQDKDLPPEVWQYLRDNGFFSLIIGKEYGGLDFSATANSSIVAKIASRSVSAAVCVMVPNSLGPGELLTRYGTEQQKNFWLPRLADGRELPCFALTGPEAGSDAGAIPDKGIICEGEFEGQKTLGIKLTWNKRYITLAPVATVLGLAFKLSDPEQLLGGKTDLGITCALIPTAHPGVEIGDRHFPMGLAFMNGTTSGKDVFIPLEWIIGGPDYAGKGWRMLVECLSAGRGISLPALATAIGHTAVKTTSAYAAVRKQFGLSIQKFEGVQESLARIIANTYTLEAARKFTTSALDSGFSPSVVTAISKYHMTEIGRQIMNDSMDIHAGKAIQLGPKNYLGHLYWGVPVAITVEGANILTRNLMIFGQGATRCHPFVYQEMQAAADQNEQRGRETFDQLFIGHVKFTATNFVRCLAHGLTLGKLSQTPVSGETAHYYQQLNRLSAGLALATDISMGVLGGALKRREMISARLGDVLSQIYLASAILKRYEEDGRQRCDLATVHYALKTCLYEAGQAFDGFFANFTPTWLAVILKRVIFPFGINYHKPEDEIAVAVCDHIYNYPALRKRLSRLCYTGRSAEQSTAAVEAAYQAMRQCKNIEQKVLRAQKDGQLNKRQPWSDTIDQALAANIILANEAEQLKQADELRKKAIAVDSFDKEQLP